MKRETASHANAVGNRVFICANISNVFEQYYGGVITFDVIVVIINSTVVQQQYASNKQFAISKMVKCKMVK